MGSIKTKNVHHYIFMVLLMERESYFHCLSESNNMYSLNWSRVELNNRQKLGYFGEYYAKMSLASYGMSIYTAEVDDHGIDFVAETTKGFLKFQVNEINDAQIKSNSEDEELNNELLVLANIEKLKE